MKNVLTVYKKVGETPLDRIKRFKKNNLDYKDKKISYAGRLDPMAEGELLLLVGNENKNRRKYEKMDKEYLFKILFSVSTDSYDILGLIRNEYKKAFPSDLEEKIDKKITDFKGKIKQKYPPFSSKYVNGNPLFYWARKGKIEEIEIPENRIEIYKLEKLSFKWIDKDSLKNLIIGRINKVKGDFRQKKIIKQWNNFFENIKIEDFPVVEYRIKCSSGTYIRAIANNLGKKINIPALALEIKRTRIYIK